MSKSKTQKYVLKPGFQHFARNDDGDVVALGAGSVVDLNETQAANFADRFELLAAVQARAKAEVAMADAATTAAAQPQEPAPAETPADPSAAVDSAAAGEAEGLPEPPPFSPVNVGEYTASGLIEVIGELELEAAIRQIADDEAARGKKKRTTVLRAADERLDELEVAAAAGAG